MCRSGLPKYVVLVLYQSMCYFVMIFFVKNIIKRSSLSIVQGIDSTISTGGIPGPEICPKKGNVARNFLGNRLAYLCIWMKSTVAILKYSTWAEITLVHPPPPPPINHNMIFRYPYASYLRIILPPKKYIGAFLYFYYYFFWLVYIPHWGKKYHISYFLLRHKYSRSFDMEKYVRVWLHFLTPNLKRYCNFPDTILKLRHVVT